MAGSNKKLLTDILKVVKEILKVLKNNSENFNPTSSKKSHRGKKKKKFDQKKLTQLVKKISKDPTYMSLGTRDIIQKIHDENPEFPLNAIQNEIQKIPQVQIYKNVDKRQEKRHYKHITAPRPFWSVQVDIMDLNEYHSSNPNHSSYRYILLFVDVFSRYIIAKPMKTKEMDEQAENIEEAINEIREKASHTEEMPKNLVSDQEFDNEAVNRVCEYYEVAQQFSTDLTKGFKTQIVERGVRSLRKMIESWVETIDDFKWENHIDELVRTYNLRKHRSIGTDPNYAVQTSTVYIPKHLQRNFESVVLNVGFHVRIKNKKSIFEKGHVAKWSREVYTITNYDEEQAKYELQDENGDILDELYARRLLQPVQMLEISSDSDTPPPNQSDNSQIQTDNSQNESENSFSPIPSQSPEIFDNTIPNYPDSDEIGDKESSPPKVGEPKIPSKGNGVFEKAMATSLLIDDSDISFDENVVDDPNRTPSNYASDTPQSIHTLQSQSESEFDAYDPNEGRNDALIQMYGTLPENAWVNVDVKGDGNCLFNSLIGELHYTTQNIIPTNLSKNEKREWKEMALKLRHECVDWLIKNRTKKVKGLQGISIENTIYFEKYNENKREKYLNDGRIEQKKEHAFQKYIKKMKKDGTWGGWLEIVACAHLKNADIVVYVYNDETQTYKNSSTIMTTNNMANVLHVYHNMEFDYGGDHYQYLIPIEMISEDNISPEKRKLKLKKSKKMGKIAKKLTSNQRQIINTRHDTLAPEIRKGKPTGKKLMVRRSLRLKKKKN